MCEPGAREKRLRIKATKHLDELIETLKYHAIFFSVSFSESLDDEQILSAGEVLHVALVGQLHFWPGERGDGRRGPTVVAMFGQPRQQALLFIPSTLRTLGNAAAVSRQARHVHFDIQGTCGGKRHIRQLRSFGSFAELLR